MILNFQKPFEQAFRLLSEIKSKAPKVEVIFVSPFDEETLWLWIEAIQRGAYEFLPKPLDLGDLKRILVQATEKHHPVKLRKFPPAESVKDLTTELGKAKCLRRKTRSSTGHPSAFVHLLRRLKTIATKAKIENETLRKFRHTYATRLRESGADILSEN